MNALLDTHTLLWFGSGDKQLSNAARTLIEAEENSIFVSMASIWEMAIKLSLGKLKLARPFDAFLEEHVDGNEFEILPIKRAHTLELVAMPMHHRDPFDRMIIAQSLTENMPIVSIDSLFDPYGVKRLW